MTAIHQSIKVLARELHELDDMACDSSISDSTLSLTEEPMSISKPDTRPLVKEWLNGLAHQPFNLSITQAPHSTTPGILVQKPRRGFLSFHVKKKVHFSSKAPEIISSAADIAQQDKVSTWYNAQERQALVEERRDLIEQLCWEDRCTTSDHTSWGAIFCSIHEATTAGNCNAKNILSKVAFNASLSNITALGLEKAVLPTISQDVFERRSELYHSIRMTQTLPSRNPRVRARKIREASYALSRSAQVYAQCVALLLSAADPSTCWCESSPRNRTMTRNVSNKC